MHTVEQLNKLFFVIQCLDRLLITSFLRARFSRVAVMYCKNLGNCYLIRRDLISMVEFVMSSQVSLITSWATLLQRRQCQVLNSFSKSVMFTGVD